MYRRKKRRSESFDNKANKITVKNKSGNTNQHSTIVEGLPNHSVVHFLNHIRNIYTIFILMQGIITQIQNCLFIVITVQISVDQPTEMLEGAIQLQQVSFQSGPLVMVDQNRILHRIKVSTEVAIYNVPMRFKYFPQLFGFIVFRWFTKVLPQRFLQGNIFQTQCNYWGQCFFRCINGGTTARRHQQH